MINETKITLSSIDENKKMFDYPINFDPMRSYNFNLNIGENGKIKKSNILIKLIQIIIKLHFQVVQIKEDFFAD